MDAPDAPPDLAPGPLPAPSPDPRQLAGQLALAHLGRLCIVPVRSLLTTRAACWADVNAAGLVAVHQGACWYLWAEEADGKRWLACLHGMPWAPEPGCMRRVDAEPTGDLFAPLPVQ